MKRPLRRVGYAIIVMVVLLLGNVAYTQVIKADDYRGDPNNKRTLVAEYSRQRGQITAAGGVVLRAGQRGRVVGVPPADAKACYTVDQYGRMAVDW